MPTATIVRGVPGSGKSTFARISSVEGFGDIISADDFFMKGERYCFDPRLLPQAHAQCLSRFIEYVKNGKNIIVDNVHSQMWEYKNYLLIAKMMGYEIKVFEIPCPDLDILKMFHSRNIHNVPYHTMEAIWNRWEMDSSAQIVS